MNTELRDGLWIERRHVPFPTSVSSQAREYLKSLVSPIGARPRPPLPGLEDIEAWRELKAEAEERISGMIRRIIGRRHSKYKGN
jgi:hypothetical protein